jgi:hypothetical protein
VHDELHESPLRRRPHDREQHGPPAVVDESVDTFGAEAAAADLAERLGRVEPGAASLAEDGRALLSPPFDGTRDRVGEPTSGRPILVVFGAYGTPSSRSLGGVLAQVRERQPTAVAVAWRHYPDPAAHPHAVMLALAAEAAASLGRFWALSSELLRMRHTGPADLHAAMRHTGVDPHRALGLMQAGTGADRIVDDVASALASGVTYSPALFIDGERYQGDVDPAAVTAALQAAGHEA